MLSPENLRQFYRPTGIIVMAVALCAIFGPVLAIPALLFFVVAWTFGRGQNAPVPTAPLDPILASSGETSVFVAPARAGTPLPWSIRITLFLVSFLALLEPVLIVPGVLIAVAYLAAGCDRKAANCVKATVYGFGLALLTFLAFPDLWPFAR